MKSHKILAAIVVAGSGVVANDAAALPAMDMAAYAIDETLSCVFGCEGTVSVSGTISVNRLDPEDVSAWDYDLVLTPSDGFPPLALVGPGGITAFDLSVVATDESLTISPGQEGMAFHNTGAPDRWFRIGAYGDGEEEADLGADALGVWSAQLVRGEEISITLSAVASPVPLPGALPVALTGIAALGGLAAARRRG